MMDDSRSKFSTRVLDKNSESTLMMMAPSVTSAQPVVHKPCSATLGKFHDSVNYSFLVTGTPHQSNKSKAVSEDEMDARAKAREKYKYMMRTKTYVDESLFGSPNSRQPVRDTPQEFFTSGKQHLSHSQMSTIAPLIHNAAATTARPGSARGGPAQQQQQQQLAQEFQRPPSARPKSRPWKP